MAGPEEEKTAAVVYRHFWQLLHDRIEDPSAPLDRTVAASAVARGGNTVRGEVLFHVVARLTHLRPADVVDTAWAATFWYTEPTVGELAWLLRSLPPGDVSPLVAGKAYDALAEETAARITPDVLDALEQLAFRGARAPRGRLADLTGQCTALTRWLRNLATTRQRPGSPAVSDLRSVSETVLQVRAAEVVDALITGTTLDNAALVVDHGHDDLRALLARKLPGIWADQGAGDGRRNAAVALAYLTASAPACAEETSGRLILALRKWAAGNGSRHDEVEKLLHAVNPDYGSTWQEALTTGALAPRKVSAPRSSAPDSGSKPAEKKDKRVIWRRAQRGRE
jgi:hypothetical protein